MKTKSVIYILIGSLIIFASILQACKKDEENNDPVPPTYTNGQGEIGNIGGTITIEDENSPLDGATLVVPPDALDNSIEIKIVNASGEIIMPGDSSAYIMKLEPAGLEFSEPVTIEFPVQNNGNESKLQAWNIQPDDQELYQLPAYYDSQKNKLIATTSHFSYFAITENGVHANTNMKYFNSNKTLLVNFSVNSWAFGNYYILGAIPSKIWSWPFGIFNAKQIIDEGDPLTGGWVLTYLNLKVKKKNNYWFDPTIKEKRIIVKRIGDINDGYGASVYEENLLDNNFKYGSSIMSSDFRESFFSGEAIVFSFPETELDNDSEYYIEAKWGIVGSPDASIIGGRYTDLYTINSIDYAKKPSEMDDAGFSDQNNNFVDEAYEETVPNDPPVASFVASTTSGTLPFSVQFTDQSSNTPTIWHWEFGDGFTGTEKNPIHTYNTAGTYSVKLTVENVYGSDTEIKDNYIQVNQSGSAPIAAFSASPTSGPAPLLVNFTDQSTNNPTTWNWDFGDGNLSTQQNPSHTYNSVGNYTVSLNVSNSFGSDIETESINILETVQGLIAYYPFNNNVNDESGNGFNGTNNGVTFVSDRFGNNNSASEYDGGNSILLPDETKLTGTQSISLWVKPYNITERELFGGSFITGPPGKGIGAGWYDNRFNVTCYDGVHTYPGSGVTSSETPINTWTHIVIVYQNNKISIYINGTEVNYYYQNIGEIDEINWGSLDFRIGWANQGYTNQYNGIIDDVRIYDYSLTINEINGLYHEGGWSK